MNISVSLIMHDADKSYHADANVTIVHSVLNGLSTCKALVHFIFP